VKITTDTADELLSRAAGDLDRLTQALEGPWEFADGSPFTLERFRTESTPQALTRDSGGVLETIGHRYVAVLVRPAATAGPLTADRVEDVLATAGFTMDESRRGGRDRYDLVATGDDGARLTVQGSARETKAIYSSAASSDPSLRASVGTRGREAFGERRARDAARNPYLDAVYADRDVERSTGRGGA
jgi:hypothetical protein